MNTYNPHVKEGLAGLVLKTFIAAALFFALWQGGYLALILPTDMLSWIWIFIMTGFFIKSGLLFTLPYQACVDREVVNYHTVMSLLRSGNRKDFARLLEENTYEEGGKNTRIYALFSYLRRQSNLAADIREKIDLNRLLTNMGNWHTLKSRPIVWQKRNLLTYGIIGTYVGIRLATAGAESMASGDQEAIFAFVVEMFKFLGLAILTTLAGMTLGTVLLGHAHERAERTMHFIINDLSAELSASGFMGWLEGGKPMADNLPAVAMPRTPDVQ